MKIWSSSTAKYTTTFNLHQSFELPNIWSSYMFSHFIPLCLYISLNCLYVSDFISKLPRERFAMILPLFNFTEKVWKLSVKCVVFSSNLALISFFYRGKNSLSIEWCEFYWADFWHGLIAELLGEIFTHLPRIKIICITCGRPWRDL